MRRNGFGEAYCTTADEVWAELETSTGAWGPDDVYAHEVGKEVGDPADAPEQLEVVDNYDGETVCWIEGKTFAECRAIAAEVGIEVQD